MKLTQGALRRLEEATGYSYAKIIESIVGAEGEQAAPLDLLGKIAFPLVYFAIQGGNARAKLEGFTDFEPLPFTLEEFEDAFSLSEIVPCINAVFADMGLNQDQPEPTDAKKKTLNPPTLRKGKK